MTGADPVPESSCELYELFRDGTFLLYGGGTDHVAKNRQVLEELLLKEITDFTLEERKGCLVFVDGEFWGLYLVGRVNTAETFARRAGGSPEEIQVIENRYPSQIATEYGELSAGDRGEYFRTRNVSEDPGADGSGKLSGLLLCQSLFR